MFLASTSLFLLLLFLSLAHSQDLSQTFFPSSIPLAVRSPYLNVWHNSTVGAGALSQSWPSFWPIQSFTAMRWRGRIKIDNTTLNMYEWMGNSGDWVKGVVSNMQLTPTRTIFTVTTGSIRLNVTFLSPIEPDDLVKQSIPFTYLSVDVMSIDGTPHDVQIWSDIVPMDWLTNTSKTNAYWIERDTTSSRYEKMVLRAQQSNMEANDHTLDGVLYHATKLDQTTSFEMGVFETVRQQFQDSGVLNNAQTNASGAVPADDYVFAFSKEMGAVSTAPQTVTWAVGYVRSPSILYKTPQGVTQNRHPLLPTTFDAAQRYIDVFIADYDNALSRAKALDDKIMGAAAQVSPHYVDLVSLSARQVFASLEVTAGTDASGNIDPSDIKIFMRDTGASQRVSPVERMYAAMPAILYINASWMSYMLQPLLENQQNISQPFAAQHLGELLAKIVRVYRLNARCREQTGNMLIMMYAHARFTGDSSLLSAYYELSNAWADYLVANALNTPNQQSADGVLADNQTNLAIKGIIAVKAFAEMSRMVGNDTNAQKYEASTLSALMNQWRSLSISDNAENFLGRYGVQNSQSLLYNLYADRLLNTSVVPQSVSCVCPIRCGQTHTSACAPFGAPIDNSTQDLTNAAWLAFCAATTTNSAVSAQLIDAIWLRASSNSSVGAFPAIYDSVDGSAASNSGGAGPSLGAMFSLLALTVGDGPLNASQTNNTGPASVGGSPIRSTRIGPIVGGAVGGFALLCLLGTGLCFYARRSQSERVKHLSMSSANDVSAVDPGILSTVWTYSNHGADSAPFLANVPTGTGTRTGSAPTSVPPLHSVLFPPSDPAPSPAAPSSEGYIPSAKALRTARPSPFAHAPSFLTEASSAPSPSSPSAPPYASADSAHALASLDTVREASESGLGSLSMSEVVDLRAEVVNLRRVMEELRTDHDGPPPVYPGACAVPPRGVVEVDDKGRLR
ncbi:uncharacterized protein BXZ73DRAFT_54569 [Epithele typhae]|uniref:uncharacterized protein n=1 Tax=Epithele typhae TaxID=378194 RepID=UPI0020082E00|nr:uncharacterized protein BXZ73DRAFT_54569 [Epithele typhae]KAH9915038.1 hypothetical protein BXZ73DRAFT_54569 [Epithele typhae]